jgi:hypothetical protein
MNQIRDRLLRLGVLEKNVSDYEFAFLSGNSAEAVENLFGERHYGADFYQIALPMIRKMLDSDLKLQDRLCDKLQTDKIDKAFVIKYLTKMGTQPYLMLVFRHSEIPAEERERLVAKAKDVLFEEISNFLRAE